MTAGSDSAGIDFSLTWGGWIGGTVTNDAGGVPLSGIEVQVYDDSGRYVGNAVTDGAGVYRSPGLFSGTYHAQTSNQLGFVDELFENIECPGPTCALGVKGADIALTTGAATTGIDFGLGVGGTISGTVQDADTGVPLASVRVTVMYQGTNTFNKAVSTSGSGGYVMSGLATGSYYVRTYQAPGHLDELFDNVPCPSTCSALPGTLVPVTIGQTTGSIDFALNSAPVTPAIAWANPSPIRFGTALGSAQLNASASYGGFAVGGTFVFDPPAGTVLPVGTGQVLSVTFTPTDLANYTPATATVTIDVTLAPLGIASLTANRTFPFTADGVTAITWTAGATGGVAPLQYRFVRYQQSTGLTTTVQALGTSPTFGWTPSASDAGLYQIGVYVRDAAGTWASRFSSLFQIVGNSLTITSLTANRTFPFTADGTTAITWTAGATGGVTPLQYRFVRWSQATNTMTTVQALGTSPTYNWTPSASDAGVCQLGVYVRDALGVWQSLFTALVQIVGQPLTITSLTANETFPFAADGVTSITWTAVATGGAAPLQYRFVRFQQSTGVTTTVQALGASATYSWTPSASDAGLYQIGVYVRDAIGVWRSLFTAIFAIVGQPLTITSLTANQTFPFTADGVTSITWTAVATGGAAPLQYRFVRYQQSTGVTTTVQALGASPTYSWTPSASDAGLYQIGVYVRDNVGTWKSLFTATFQIQ